MVIAEKLGVQVALHQAHVRFCLGGDSAFISGYNRAGKRTKPFDWKATRSIFAEVLPSVAAVRRCSVLVHCGVQCCEPGETLVNALRSQTVRTGKFACVAQDVSGEVFGATCAIHGLYQVWTTVGVCRWAKRTGTG